MTHCGICCWLRGRPCGFSHSSAYLGQCMWRAWCTCDSALLTQIYTSCAENCSSSHRDISVRLKGGNTVISRNHTSMKIWRFARESREHHMTMAVEVDWNDDSGKSLCGKWAYDVWTQWGMFSKANVLYKFYMWELVLRRSCQDMMQDVSTQRSLSIAEYKVNSHVLL